VALASQKWKLQANTEREQQIQIWNGLEYDLTIIGFLEEFIHTAPN
jgi:hypothetical protein